MNLEILNSCCPLYKVGSLDECDAELANYGPENFSSRITVKMKEGQETAVEIKAPHPGVFIFRYLLYCFIFIMIASIPFIRFRAFTFVL